jgi:hypothetical protein
LEKLDQSERHLIAQELITFDAKFSHLFSGKPAAADQVRFSLFPRRLFVTNADCLDQSGVSMEEFRNVFVAAGKWTSGTVSIASPNPSDTC